MDERAHYTDFDWVQYVAGHVTAEVVSKMEAHLSACRECQQRSDLYRKLYPLIRSGEVEPPSEWIDESVRQFGSARLSEGEPPQIFAELTYDSFVRDPEGMRSRTLEERHAKFQSVDFEVNVLLQTGGGLLQLVVGQLHAKNAVRVSDVENVEAELHVGDRIHATHTNPQGEFLFDVSTPVTGDPLEIRFRFKEGPCLTLMILC